MSTKGNDTFGDDFEKELAAKPSVEAKPKIDGGKVQLPPQKIITLRAENVKRLTVVDITPGNGVIRITGNNGAGKSSVLDAISMALQGKGQALTRPVREGKDKAYVLLETNDLNIKRVWTQKGESGYLEVTGKDGTEVTSPQRLLDRLVSKVAIDPLAFIGLSSKEQAEQLMKLFPPADPESGEVFNLGENRKMIELAMDTRKEKAAVLKSKQADYARLKDVPNDDVQPVDVKAMNAQLRDLRNKQGTHLVLLTRHQTTRDEIARLEKQLSEARALLVETTSALRNTPDPTAEIDLLQKQIEDASEINAKAAKIAEKKSVLEAGRSAKKEFEDAEARITALRAKRVAAFKSIEYPLEGLSINDDGDLLYNGLPIDQCCTSEQIKIGIALGSAASPGMRIAFIKDGSLLDDDSMAKVAELAEAFNMQIIVERVADNDPTAIHIVEGSNVGATDADGKPGKKDEVFG